MGNWCDKPGPNSLLDTVNSLSSAHAPFPSVERSLFSGGPSPCSLLQFYSNRWREPFGNKQDGENVTSPNSGLEHGALL